jgi:hypothetical protein
MQLTGRREPISMSGAGKAAGRHTPPQAALFFPKFKASYCASPADFGRILASA